MYDDADMKKIIITAIGLLAVLGALYFCAGTPGNKDERRQYAEESYRKCEAAIETGAASLEQWHVDLCNGRTKSTAGALTGLRAKWEAIKALGDEKKMEMFFNKVVERELISAQSCQEAWMQAIVEVTRQWEDIENELAMQTECYALSSEAKAEKLKEAPVNGGKIGDHDLIRKKLRDSLISDGVSMVTSEIATTIAIQIAVSTGVLTTATVTGPVTFGAGFVVGVLVDIVIDYFTDPSGKVQKSLDEQMVKMGAEQKAMFREKMKEVLDARYGEWKKQLGI